jgi:hypothetical protein
VTIKINYPNFVAKVDYSAGAFCANIKLVIEQRVTEPHYAYYRVERSLSPLRGAKNVQLRSCETAGCEKAKEQYNERLGECAFFPLAISLRH